MNLRLVKHEDAQAIADIYAPFISTTITFENTAPDETEFMQRIESIASIYPWIVLEDEGIVKGYAYLSTFNVRTAYQHSADLSIYLSSDIKSKGYGKKMCEALFEIAKAQNICRIVSLITAENTPSKLFHHKLGFECQGILKNVGYKHDKWLDVSFYVKDIETLAHPEPMIPVINIKEKAQSILDLATQQLQN